MRDEGVKVGSGGTDKREERRDMTALTGQTEILGALSQRSEREMKKIV
jgi:hypothetical protein